MNHEIQAMIKSWNEQSAKVPCLQGIHLAEALQIWDTFEDDPQGDIQNEIDSIFIADEYQNTLSADWIKLTAETSEQWSRRYIMQFLQGPGFNHNLTVSSNAQFKFMNQEAHKEPTSNRDIRALLYITVMLEESELLFSTTSSQGDEGGELRMVYLLKNEFAKHYQEFYDQLDEANQNTAWTHEIANFRYVLEFPNNLMTIWQGPY
jgi:hypothetical protein